MEQFERDDFDELVSRFKVMVNENRQSFFDSEEMEIIIEDLLYNFEFEFCERAIEHAINTFPQLSIFHILKAKKFRLAIEFEKAKAELEMVEERFPPTAELYKEKYILNSILEDDPNTFLLLLKAKEMYPEDPETQYLLAFEYLKQDDMLKALNAIMFAIKENEEFADRLYNFSYYFEHHAKHTDALYFYQTLTEKLPMTKGAWFGLGLSYSWMANHEEAINAYKYALSLDEDIPTAHFNIGNSYFDMEDYDNAISHYKTALKLDFMDYNSLACLGDCYYKLGDLELATEHYRKALELMPDNLDALYGMINLTKDKNNRAAVRNYILKAMETAPDNFDLIFLATELFDDENYEEKMIEFFDYTLSLVENKVIHFDNFAFYCCLYDHFEEGIALFNHYASHKDLVKKGNYYLAAFYYLAGKEELGKRFLCHALVSNFDEYDYFLKLDARLEKNPAIINLIEIFRPE